MFINIKIAKNNETWCSKSVIKIECFNSKILFSNVEHYLRFFHVYSHEKRYVYRTISFMSNKRIYVQLYLEEN